jgi:hypothetical protein
MISIHQYLAAVVDRNRRSGPCCITLSWMPFAGSDIGTALSVFSLQSWAQHFDRRCSSFHTSAGGLFSIELRENRAAKHVTNETESPILQAK